MCAHLPAIGRLAGRRYGLPNSGRVRFPRFRTKGRTDSLPHMTIFVVPACRLSIRPCRHSSDRLRPTRDRTDSSNTIFRQYPSVEEFGQARMPAPPDTAFLERKVGQTFLSGAREQFFNCLLSLDPQSSTTVNHPLGRQARFEFNTQAGPAADRSAGRQ